MTNDTQRDDIVGGCFECGSPHGMMLKQGDGPTCIKCNPELAADLIEKQRSEIEELRASLDVAEAELALREGPLVPLDEVVKEIAND